MNQPHTKTPQEKCTIKNFVNRENIKLLINIATCLFAIGSFYTLLPNSKSNISISEDSIKIFRFEKKIAIVPTIKNIGHATAQEIRFRIFLIPIRFMEKDASEKKLGVWKPFDEFLAHDLQPGQDANFGSIQLESSENTSDFLIVYHLSYTDTLTFPLIKWWQKNEDRYFIFKYNTSGKRDFGPDQVLTATNNIFFREQSKSLIEYLEEKKEDSKLQNFLERILKKSI